jgi:hypothetical protein
MCTSARFALIASLAFALALARPAAAAQGETKEPGDETHDGPYVRFLLGPGYTSMSAGEGFAAAKSSGSGPGLSFALGGAVVTDVIVFGELLSNQATKPTTTIGTGTLKGASAGNGGLGFGVAYFVMPVNAYLSGALTVSRQFPVRQGCELAPGGGKCMTV